MKKKKGKQPKKQTHVALLEWFDDHVYRIIPKPKAEPISITSVTTKLGVSPKPWLGRWRGNVGNREADRVMSEAAEAGSRIHYACQQYLQGGCVIFNPPYYKKQNYSAADVKKLTKKYHDGLVILQTQEEQVMMWRFQAVVAALKPQILYTEEVVYDIGLDAAGTTDAVWNCKAGPRVIAGYEFGLKDSGLYIVDYKTGNEDDDHLLQVSTYGTIYEKMHPDEKLAGAIIIYLGAGKLKNGLKGLKVVVVPKAAFVKNFNVYKNMAATYEWKYGRPDTELFQFPILITMRKGA